MGFSYEKALIKKKCLNVFHDWKKKFNLRKSVDLIKITLNYFDKSSQKNLLETSNSNSTKKKVYFSICEKKIELYFIKLTKFQVFFINKSADFLNQLLCL